MFVDNTKLPIESKVAILSISIGATIVLMQFTIKHYYSLLKENENKSFEALVNKLDLLHTEIELNEVYKKFLSADEKLRPFIQATLESNNAIVKKYIDEKRTGALEISLYYKQLQICADGIINDKLKNKTTHYNGEIWALSSFLDDEWINEGLEGAWLRKLLEADKQGVPTRRLYIFPKEKVTLLKNGGANERAEIVTFLTELKPYCDKSDSSQYKETISYAIERESFPQNLLNAVGKGFFATKLANGEMTLIRDVSIDNLSSNNLGGEIDFNENKINETRDSWEHLVQSGIKLNEFLHNGINPSDTTIAVLREIGIKND